MSVCTQVKSRQPKRPTLVILSQQRLEKNANFVRINIQTLNNYIDRLVASVELSVQLFDLTPNLFVVSLQYYVLCMRIVCMLSTHEACLHSVSSLFKLLMNMIRVCVFVHAYAWKAAWRIRDNNSYRPIPASWGINTITSALIIAVCLSTGLHEKISSDFRETL